MLAAEATRALTENTGRLRWFEARLLGLRDRPRGRFDVELLSRVRGNLEFFPIEYRKRFVQLALLGQAGRIRSRHTHADLNAVLAGGNLVACLADHERPVSGINVRGVVDF